MTSYFLNNYELSCCQFLQSFVVSEYGLRHLEAANRQERWGHYFIALLEFVPVLGQIVMLIEWVAAKFFKDPSLQEVCLFSGTQTGSEGSVDPSRVLSIVERMNRLKERGIDFNRSKITGYVEGGSCSAMALEFADTFFKLNSAQRVTNLFLNRLRSLEAKFAGSSEEMRMRQAAFNTIEVAPQNRGGDVARNKVQSLANFHGFHIDHSSREIFIDRADSNQVVKEEVSKLPDGLYLLRTIKPSDNARLEEHGHSMIYVKDREDGFFYDPNEGVKWIQNGNESHSSRVFKSLAECYAQFQTSRARLYRLSPTSPTT